jgi:hypothetical protein
MPRLACFVSLFLLQNPMERDAKQQRTIRPTMAAALSLNPASPDGESCGVHESAVMGVWGSMANIPP